MLERHCTHLCSQGRQSAGSLHGQSLLSALQICFRAMGALFSHVCHQSIPSDLVTNTRNILPSSTLPSSLHLPLLDFKPIWGPVLPSLLPCKPTVSASLQNHPNIPFFPPPRYRKWMFLNFHLDTKPGKAIQIRRPRSLWAFNLFISWPKLIIMSWYKPLSILLTIPFTCLNRRL